MKAGIHIRYERPEDRAAIRTINEQAFDGTGEADLVDALRAAGGITLSLVAETGGTLVGHILFSPVSIETPSGSREAIALAPMAILPEYQRRGIGSQLVRDGLAELTKMGYGAVVVLGHPEYYPRFGFMPASGFDLRCLYDCPDEAYMALELHPGALANLKEGVVHYPPEFDAV
ncbi:MAG: GNAT family N-acetyltransferase [Leptospirillia bacterium]